MPMFKDSGHYCFAHVCQSVHMSVFNNLCNLELENAKETWHTDINQGADDPYHSTGQWVKVKVIFYFVA